MVSQTMYTNTILTLPCIFSSAHRTPVGRITAEESIDRRETLTSHGSAQIHSMQPSGSVTKPLVQSLPAQSTSGQVLGRVGSGDGVSLRLDTGGGLTDVGTSRGTVVGGPRGERRTQTL